MIVLILGKKFAVDVGYGKFWSPPWTAKATESPLSHTGQKEIFSNAGLRAKVLWNTNGSLNKNTRSQLTSTLVPLLRKMAALGLQKAIPGMDCIVSAYLGLFSFVWHLYHDLPFHLTCSQSDY